MSKLINIVGQRFGMLTVIELADKDKRGNTMWRCLCDCGNEKVIQGGNLRAGKRKSCGCMKSGKGGIRSTKLYTTWYNIKAYCNDTKSPFYKEYGGRGIEVCAEWEKDFHAFRLWALSNGYKEGMKIERISKEKGYSPDNCRCIPESL